MNCKEFNLLINDFVKEKIEDELLIKRFIEHAKECDDCYEELEVLYSMYRAIEDIEMPKYINEEDATKVNYDNEVKQIIQYYELKFKREKRNNIIKTIVVFALFCIVGGALIAALTYLK